MKGGCGASGAGAPVGRRPVDAYPVADLIRNAAGLIDARLMLHEVPQCAVHSVAQFRVGKWSPGRPLPGVGRGRRPSGPGAVDRLGIQLRSACDAFPPSGVLADTSVLGGDVQGGPVQARDVDQDDHASVGQRLLTCGYLGGRVHYLRLAFRHGERPDVGTADVQ